MKIWKNQLLEKGLSPARIHTIRNVMTLMYKDALEDEIITKSPSPIRKILNFLTN